MKRIKFLVGAALLTATSIGAGAAALSPDAALARVTQRGLLKAASISPERLELVYTQDDAHSEAACYVFGQNNGHGYLVVSADDLVPALLGYSDEGSFDVTAMPEPMKYWLESYAAQIEWARRNQTAPQKAAERPERAKIAPLVKTKWNQDSPYNDNCPSVSGRKCYTGCVATAMAQAMNYHKWPAKGEGSHSYTWRNETLSMDFSTVTFDWDNMLDTYGSDATEAQKQAVATLMNACGISVDMAYGTGSSGAVQANIASALSTYFGYSKGVYSATRDFYGLIDWENLIYENLRDCGPVVYGGQSNDGGHSFICDGYSRDGYFHINWGWGGMSDGYFLLTALDPGSQGIGGSTSGYNFDQDAIVGMKKPGENDDYHYIMGASDNLKFEQESAQLGGWVLVDTPTFNYSSTTFTGQFGIKIESLTNDDVIYGTGSTFEDLEPLHGFSKFYLKLPSDIPEGDYSVTTVFKKTEGEWQEVSFPVGVTRYLNMKVEGKTATFSTVPSASVTVTEIAPQTKIYVGRDFYLTATITNTSDSEFLGEMTGVLIDSNNKIVATGDVYPIDLLGGQSTTVDYFSAFKEFTGAAAAPALNGTAPRRALAAGNYQLAFVKGELNEHSSADIANHTLLSEKVDVQVEADPGAATLEITDLKFAEGVDTDAVNAYQMNLTANVKCTQGYATDALKLYIFKLPGLGAPVGSLTSDPLLLSAGETKEVTFKGRFDNGEPGKEYLCQINNGGWVGNSLTFKLATVFTGLDATSVDKQVSSVKVFNLNGVCVGESTNVVAPGLYIVVTTYNDGTVKSAKLVKQ